MPEIELPCGGWRPRPYQERAWKYLRGGGLHAELVWHRRSGKDEVALHYAAIAAHLRPATYWHMLPLANQARKAIWDAINPHTGKRRIDEAFPRELRAATRENEMLIKFKIGSTWQVIGSDNYQAIIGSPPAGIVYSEWAQANPAARAYLRPIIAENRGWQLFITTPRGKNHAHRTFKNALTEPGAFAELLTAEQTGVFSAEQLEAERHAYSQDHGEDQGRALYEQEYLCSFDAAVLGAYYGSEFARLEQRGGIRQVVVDKDFPVHTVWDLGYDDDTAIWFYQVIAGEIRLIDCYANSGKDISHYAGALKDRGHTYGDHWLPHDARAKTLAANGRSIEQQLSELLGWGTIRIVPHLSLEDGIQAARKMFPRTYFDTRCDSGVEALKQYRRVWDEDRRKFHDKPFHDWTSHYADAFRYLAVAWQEELPTSKGDGQQVRDAYDLDDDDGENWKTA